MVNKNLLFEAMVYLYTSYYNETVINEDVIIDKDYLIECNNIINEAYNDYVQHCLYESGDEILSQTAFNEAILNELFKKPSLFKRVIRKGIKYGAVGAAAFGIGNKISKKQTGVGLKTHGQNILNKGMTKYNNFQSNRYENKANNFINKANELKQDKNNQQNIENAEKRKEEQEKLKKQREDLQNKAKEAQERANQFKMKVQNNLNTQSQLNKTLNKGRQMTVANKRQDLNNAAYKATHSSRFSPSGLLARRKLNNNGIKVRTGLFAGLRTRQAARQFARNNIN